METLDSVQQDATPANAGFTSVEKQSIACFKSHIITKGKNVGKTKFIITCSDGTVVWSDIAPTANQNLVYFKRSMDDQTKIFFEGLGTASMSAQEKINLFLNTETSAEKQQGLATLLAAL
jgi:hypothetical protein